MASKTADVYDCTESRGEVLFADVYFSLLPAWTILPALSLFFAFDRIIDAENFHRHFGQTTFLLFKNNKIEPIAGWPMAASSK